MQNKTSRDVEGAVPYKEDLFFGFLPYTKPTKSDKRGRCEQISPHLPFAVIPKYTTRPLVEARHSASLKTNSEGILSRNLCFAPRSCILFLHLRIVLVYRLRKSTALTTPCSGRFRFIKNNTQLFFTCYNERKRTKIANGIKRKPLRFSTLDKPMKFQQSKRCDNKYHTFKKPFAVIPKYTTISGRCTFRCPYQIYGYETRQ